MGQPQEFVINNFSGGLNDTTSELLVKPPEMISLVNAAPDVRGPLRCRQTGYASVGTAGSSNPVIAIRKFYRESTTADDLLLAACSTQVYDLTNGANFAVIDDMTATNAHCSFMQKGDLMYMTSWESDTTHRMRVKGQDPTPASDEDTLEGWVWGLTAPSQALDTATGDPGIPNGWYVYRHAWKYGHNGRCGESNLSAASTALNCSSDKIDVEIVGASSQYATWALAHAAGIHGAVLYRTIGHATQALAEEAAEDGEVFWCADVEPADTTAGVYEDNADDEDDLDPTIPYETDHFVPPDAKYAVLFNDRAILGHGHDGDIYRPGRTWYSLASLPDAFPNDYYQDAPVSCGRVQGFFVLNGQLYVGYESAIARLDIHGENSSLTVVTEEQGVLAPNSIAVGTDGGMPVAFFVGVDGEVYTFNGQTVNRLTRDIAKTFTSAAAGVWDGEAYRVSASSGAEYRYYTEIRKADPYTGGSVGTWWPQSYNGLSQITCFFRAAGPGDGGQLYIGNSASDGKVYKLDSGLTDNGAVLVGLAGTGVISFGSRGVEVRVKEIMLDLEPIISTDQVQVYYWTDYFSTSPNGVYGVVYFDVDEYRVSHKFPEGLKCEAIRLMLSALPRGTRVHGVTIRYEVMRKDRA